MVGELFDPFALGPDVDRYTVFARFRAAGEYSWGVGPYPQVGQTIYLFSHRLISDVFKHPEMFQAPPGEYREVRRQLGRNPFWAMMFRTVLTADPPRHGELRRFMGRSFSAASVAALEATFRRRARALADEFRSAETFDLVRDLAVPLSLEGLEKTLGIHLGDPIRFKELTTKLADGLDFSNDMETPAANDACAEMVDFVEALVAHQSYREGLLATLVELRDQGALVHEDLVANIVLLSFAGQETVADMVGNAIMALHQNPQQREMLRSGSVDLGQAVSELLRYDSSIHFTGNRIAARDLQIGDLFIPEGQGAVGVLASGNRDEATFDDPDRLDLTRAANTLPMSFGMGMHTCIGRNVALLELQIALETLYQYLPPWELNAAACVRRPAVNWRGLTTAPAYFV